jgi:predicted permease
MVFIGYFLSYKQWFSNRTADVFSKIVLTLALPCNMFMNMTANFSRAQFLGMFSGMLIPLISILATFIVSLIYLKVTHVPPTRRGAFSTMFACSNTIFIGLPINLAVFGEKAVPYVLLYYIVNTTFYWTICVYLMAKDNPTVQKEQMTFHPLIVVKKVLSPALMGFIIGLLWVLLHLPLPDFLANLGNYVGNLTTPLSMFTIGIIIYFNGIKNLKMNKDIAGVLLGRYLLSPLIVWLLGFVIKVPVLMLQVFILQSAMPVQNSVPIIARAYGSDDEFAASSLAYSVLLYLLYVPLLLQLIY